MNYIHKSLDEKKEECISLLQSIDRTDIDKLIAHITKMGYFIAPGSKGHHRFIGGLVSHSLETYHKAMEIRQELIEKGVDAAFMPQQSIIIATLMHDLCKADALRFDEQTHKVYDAKNTSGHSARSVRQVGYSGFKLTPQEEDAILWHMGGRRYIHGSDAEKKSQRDQHLAENPLAYLVYHADKRSIKEAKRRHHSKEKSLK